MRSRVEAIRALLAAVLLLAACRAPTTTPDVSFDAERAYEHVVAQCELGPRPTGSQANLRTGEYILAQLEAVGWSAQVQEFSYRGVTGRNIIAARGAENTPVILGAHYDTRPVADRDPLYPDQPILGANDGASGVAVLLELARVLDADVSPVQLMFFDAEDRGNLDGWPFSVGAAYAAEQLQVEPSAVIVVDMIGDKEQQVYWEGNSDPGLREELWAVAAELGFQDYIIANERHTIIDDHLPFKQRGYRAVDMIDFDYPYWHTTQDTIDKVSPESLGRIGRTLETWLES